MSQYTHVNNAPIEYDVKGKKTMDFILPAHPFEGDWFKVDGSGYFIKAEMLTSGPHEVVEANEDSNVDVGQSLVVPEFGDYMAIRVYIVTPRAGV